MGSCDSGCVAYLARYLVRAGERDRVDSREGFDRSVRRVYLNSLPTIKERNNRMQTLNSTNPVLLSDHARLRMAQRANPRQA